MVQVFSLRDKPSSHFCRCFSLAYFQCLGHLFTTILLGSHTRDTLYENSKEHLADVPDSPITTEPFLRPCNVRL